MTSDRPNTDLAAAINEALAVQLEHGRKTAARFLMSRGAGFALTCRVLAEPGRRRPTCEKVLLDVPEP
jgi:hypothetical protein